MNSFLVAKKISQRGLKMKPFISKVVFENQKEIKKRGDKMLELINDIVRSVR